MDDGLFNPPDLATAQAVQQKPLRSPRPPSSSATTSRPAPRARAAAVNSAGVSGARGRSYELEDVDVGRTPSGSTLKMPPLKFRLPPPEPPKRMETLRTMERELYKSPRGTAWRSPREAPASVIEKANAMLQRIAEEPESQSALYLAAHRSSLDLHPPPPATYPSKPTPGQIAAHARQLFQAPHKLSNDSVQRLPFIHAGAGDLADDAAADTHTEQSVEAAATATAA